MADIKISELSIGDWISDKNGIVAQVRDIECWSDGYVVIVRTRAGTITRLTVEGVCPIPLLPKILEKNGFRLVVVNKNFNDWHDNNITIRKYYNEDNYHLFVCGQKVEFKMLFIHQLQHALRLAGVGKEIEV